MAELDPTERFSTRVENYARYRPNYPSEVLEVLKAECGLTPLSVIADIGSGTGILSKLFLVQGNKVYGVEPNRNMRQAAEKLLKEQRRFISVASTAENTTLPDQSVDFVTAAQAFHWFDMNRSRLEFGRILRPFGWVVLVWNERRAKTTPFLKDYEQLLQQFSVDYKSVKGRVPDLGVMVSFFGDRSFKFKVIMNRQMLDFNGLKGRLLSSSYTPEEGHPSYPPMLEALEEIYHRHEVDGQIAMDYETKMYYGRLPALNPISREE